MCGISGVVHFDPNRPVDPAVLKRMCDSIVHRGPDDEGYEVRGCAGIGMRRLSIIDLNTGHQPLSNEDGSVSIVFNGEIYNFMELRALLEKAGHRFRTRSDTEVIVHGYEEWGEAVCGRLNGIFAFAIWDDRRKKLALGRDALGVKPLYVYRDSDKLAFGSEIKSILRCPGVSRTLDPDALNAYLTFEYVPGPMSIFREIRKLEPGHWMTLENGTVRTGRYWSGVPAPAAWTEEAAAERLRELLHDAVRIQLVSDVPLGAFLSGGIDSSIMVSRMARCMDRPVKTFSIGFRESSYNELKYARAVARKYGTEHRELVIEPRALELTETLVRHLDEPFGDFSIFPTYLVSKMAREAVTVVLSGDGGDELFAGYDTYRAHRFDRRFYHRLPKAVKRGLLDRLARSLPPTESKKGPVNSFKRFVQGTWLPKELMHGRWMVFLSEAERRALLTDGTFASLSAETPYESLLRFGREAAAADDVARMGYVDVKTYLPDDILVKVDRMSMAVSLEARVPFLDPRVVEFALSLPADLKTRGFDTKRILKKAFWDDLPPEVQNRGKQGFSIPIKNWIRNELRPMMQDLLSEDRIRRQGLFRPEFVSALVKEHMDGAENHSHKLWALMVFEQWFDLYSGEPHA
jgi:asparagine synthase (glutamine-hydrolysing)